MKKLPILQNSLLSCCLRSRSSIPEQASESWQAQNSLTLAKVSPKPRCPLVPMAALWMSYSLPKTSSPLRMIVSILPPVSMDLAMTLLMPWALSLRVTNSMPTLRMVGSVGGMAVMRRSMYMRNMSISLVCGPSTARQAKQMRLAMKMMMQMKQMVSRKNCSLFLLWQRIARRYFPRSVLKFVCVTRHTISLAESILSYRIDDSMHSSQLSAVRFDRYSMFLVLTIWLPRQSTKLFQFSLRQVKFSISSLRMRQFYPVLYFSLARASPLRRMQSQGTMSSSLRMMMSPGTSWCEESVWKRTLRLLMRLFSSLRTSLLLRLTTVISTSSCSMPLKLSFMICDLCSSTFNPLVHNSTSSWSSSELPPSSTSTFVCTSKYDSQASFSWLLRISLELLQQVYSEYPIRISEKTQYYSQIHRIIPQVWNTQQGVSISWMKISRRLCTCNFITFQPQQPSSSCLRCSESGRNLSRLSLSRWWPSSQQRMGTKTSFSSTQMQLRSRQMKAGQVRFSRISYLSCRCTSVISPQESSSSMRKWVAVGSEQMVVRKSARLRADHFESSHRKPKVRITPKMKRIVFSLEV